ncbi:MAG: VOC family protein [Pseudomonadota bacterium]
MTTKHGDIHWSELVTRDTAGARAYFESIAGWSVEEVPMGDGQRPYLVCSANGHPVAGIMEMGGPDLEGMAPAWITYIHVDDVDAACAKTSELGGKVISEPFDVPMAGRIATVVDPTGAMVGLITPNQG